MQTLKLRMLTARLREHLADRSHWTVITARVVAPTLFGLLIAAVGADARIGPDDVVRGEIDAFSPEMILSIAVLMIRRTNRNRSTFLELPTSGGWAPVRPEGKQDLFAVSYGPDALLNLRAHLRRGTCIPIDPSADIRCDT